MAEEPSESAPETEAADDAEQADESAEPESDAEQADEAAEPEDDLPPVEATAEDVGPLRKKVVITVPAERINAKRDESIGELNRTAQVPGFRIGRAPRRLIEKRFGTELARDLKGSMIALGYSKAVEQLDLKVLGEPDFDEDKLEAIEVPDDGPLTFDVEVEVQPEFELPELEKIPVTRPFLEITDEQVGGAIDRWRGNFATLEEVEGPAEVDDVLVAHVAFEPEGGERREHPNLRIAVRPQAVEGVPIEDLGERLTGAKAGDQVTVETTVPGGHPDEAIRGKKATFTFSVRQVRRVRLPELDEQFLGRFGFEKPDAFRGWVGEQLQAEAGAGQQRDMRRQVFDYLLGQVKLELPEGVLGRMRERAVQRRANELMMRGMPRNELDKHVDELSVAAGEEAARELKSFFITQRVAEQLEIEVSEEEVNASIASMAAQYGQRPDSLRADLERRDALEQFYLQVREQKAIDRLLEQADITDAKPEPKPEAKSPAKQAKQSTKKSPAKKSAKKKSAKKAKGESEEA